MLTDTHWMTCRQQMDRDVHIFQKMKQSKKNILEDLLLILMLILIVKSMIREERWFDIKYFF